MPSSSVWIGLAEAEEAPVDGPVVGLEDLDRGQRGGQRQRVAVVRAAEHDGPLGTRVEALHQVGPAAQHRERVAVGDRLGERGQVRRDAADRLVAAEVVAEPGHDLVEDQDRAGLGRRPPQRRHEFVGRDDAADRVDDRFEDDRGDLVTALAHQVLERLDVVERQHHQPLEGLGQDAGRDRVDAADPVGLADDVGRDVVVPAVIAALELHDAGSGRSRPARRGSRGRSPPSRCSRTAPARPTGRARGSSRRAGSRARSTRRRRRRSRRRSPSRLRGRGRRHDRG